MLVCAGPFLDLRSPLGITPAALKLPPPASPVVTPESSPAEKPRRTSNSTPIPQSKGPVRSGMKLAPHGMLHVPSKKMHLIFKCQVHGREV